ncbi:hypothetical protein HNV12_03660 [Methanococcoides sp. SA1]|nr:hypothetical protein [Methanococcoides sp. SA1]
MAKNKKTFTINNTDTNIFNGFAKLILFLLITKKEDNTPEKSPVQSEI